MSSKRTFLYHSHGYALGGRIQQPIQKELDSHSATTLSIVGGYANSKSGPYQLDDLLSYESAHTTISGIRNEDGIYSTSVDTVIYGLNVLDMITADKIVGRLSARHVDGERPQIIPLGSGFENLRIAGTPVDVEMLHELFGQHPTHDELVSHFRGLCTPAGSCPATRPAHTGRYQWGLPPGDAPDKLKQQAIVPIETGWTESSDELYCSIVGQVREVSHAFPAKSSVPYGHAFSIPEVGRVFLGELSSRHDTKRLTMLRLELGSPVVGRIAAAGPTTNGKWFP